MTADDWHTSNHLEAMLDVAKKTITDDQVRIFAANCLEANQVHVPGAEFLARNLRSSLLSNFRQREPHGILALFHEIISGNPMNMFRQLMSRTTDNLFPIARMTTAHICNVRRTNFMQAAGPNEIRLPPIEPIWEQELCELLRDILRNPLREAPPFDPAWRTDTVLTLHRLIHEDHKFDLTPILADALQDAGCDDNELMLHLREFRLSCYPTPHAPGCWALASAAPRQSE